MCVVSEKDDLRLVLILCYDLEPCVRDFRIYNQVKTKEHYTTRAYHIHIQTCVMYKVDINSRSCYTLHVTYL